jgi:hypothetical protein
VVTVPQPNLSTVTWITPATVAVYLMSPGAGCPQRWNTGRAQAIATIACWRVSPNPGRQVRPRTTGLTGRAPCGVRQYEAGISPEDGKCAISLNDRPASVESSRRSIRIGGSSRNWRRSIPGVILTRAARDGRHRHRRASRESQWPTPRDDTSGAKGADTCALPALVGMADVLAGIFGVLSGGGVFAVGWGEWLGSR